LSPRTVSHRRWQIEHFLRHGSSGKASIADMTVGDVDAFLDSKGRDGWSRVSIATSAAALRSFFRHAEMRGWCSSGIAAAIDAPRLFKQEGIPRSPRWVDVQRLMAGTGGDDPRDMRDHAILMLFAIHGLRSGEVRGLRLEDLDWTRELIMVERPKQRRTQYYPLVASVGNAIVRYLQGVRPRCTSREVFVTLKAPFRALSAGGMYYAVASRLNALGIQTGHHGPHGLRHACAAHLVEAGLSLKEIGDHLGHRGTYATRTYAKVDLVGLREVAAFDLGGLS
jgi:integrase/recombinase XerD